MPRVRLWHISDTQPSRKICPLLISERKQVRAPLHDRDVPKAEPRGGIDIFAFFNEGDRSIYRFGENSRVIFAIAGFAVSKRGCNLVCLPL